MTVIRHIIESTISACLLVGLVCLFYTQAKPNLQHCAIAGIDPTMPEKMRNDCLKAKNEH
jgi:hypothetical protein